MEERVKVGLIMPHATDILPAEGMELYPDIEFLARGVGVTSLTPGGYDDAVGNILPAAKELAARGAKAISVFGTSLSFYRGAGFNAELIERIEDETGLPATSMSTAIADGLREVGATRVIVVTAYADEVNHRLRDFLTEEGFEVLALKGFGVERFGGAGGITGGDITAMARELYRAEPQAEGLLISCGGLKTLALAAPIEAEAAIPVVSSTPAALWKAAQLVGKSAGATGYGRLLEA